MLIKTLRLTLVLLAIAVTWPASAAAQPPPQAPPPPPPPRHEATAQLAFVGTTGNTKERTLSVGGEYLFRPTNWVVKNRFDMIRGDTDGVLDTESTLYGFRVERVLNSRLSAFGEYAYFRDQFAGIDARNGVTGGIMFKVITSDRQTLSADVGLGYLDEQRLAGEDIGSATYSGGAAYRLKLSPNAELTDELRLLGTFDRSEDWRVSNTFAVTAKLTTMFSLKFSTTVRHLNFPTPGFTGTDTTTSIALVAAFKSGPK